MKNRESRDKIIWLGIVAIFVAVVVFFGCSEQQEAPNAPMLPAGKNVRPDSGISCGDPEVCCYDCYGDPIAQYCEVNDDGYYTASYWVPFEELQGWSVEEQREYCRFRHKHKVNGVCDSHKHPEGFKDHPAYHPSECFGG